MTKTPHSLSRLWIGKFRNAFRGLRTGVRGQNSFVVHLPAAALVVAAGAALRVDCAEWAILAACIAGVLAAEQFNSALESMAKSVTDRSDPNVGNALDISAAAVLLSSIGAAAAGTIVFAHRVGMLLRWW
jgi:diacylglycerol kinase